MPISRAARIVGMAFAPIAGANGGELLLAPSAQAIDKQETIATAVNAMKAADTMIHRSVG